MGTRPCANTIHYSRQYLCRVQLTCPFELEERQVKISERMIILTQQRLNCYECENNECNDDEQSLILYACEDAVACWKSTVRDVNGTLYNNRGCISNPDHLPFMCSRNSSNSLDNRFRVECCSQNMCNSGAFPLLQNSRNSTDIDQAMMSSLMLTILVPILFLGFITLFAIMWCRHRHAKTHRSSSNRHLDLREKSLTISEQHKRYGLSFGNVFESSIGFAVPKTEKKLSPNIFLNFAAVPKRFFNTKNCSTANFIENEESSGSDLEKVIL